MRYSRIAALALLLAACSATGEEDATERVQPTLPPFYAACEEVVAAVDQFGGDRVFRHHVEGMLMELGLKLEDADAIEGAAATLATRDRWLGCDLEEPQSARALVRSAERLVGQAG